MSEAEQLNKRITEAMLILRTHRELADNPEANLTTAYRHLDEGIMRAMAKLAGREYPTPEPLVVTAPRKG